MGNLDEKLIGDYIHSHNELNKTIIRFIKEWNLNSNNQLQDLWMYLVKNLHEPIKYSTIDLSKIILINLRRRENHLNHSLRALNIGFQKGIQRA